MQPTPASILIFVMPFLVTPPERSAKSSIVIEALAALKVIVGGHCPKAWLNEGDKVYAAISNAIITFLKTS